MAKMTVAELLVETLVAAGVKRVFGVVGDSLMEKQRVASLQAVSQGQFTLSGLRNSDLRAELGRGNGYRL